MKPRPIKEVTKKPDTGGGPVDDMWPRPKKGPKGFKKPIKGV